MGLPVTFDKNEDNDYPEEAVFKVATLFGYTELRTDAGDDVTFGCEYIRVVESVSGDPADAVENGFWHYAEWADDPQGVMGAILGALSGVSVFPIDGPDDEPING